MAFWGSGGQLGIAAWRFATPARVFWVKWDFSGGARENITKKMAIPAHPSTFFQE
jgi:hypothetical protein